jgi:hypothetical protein
MEDSLTASIRDMYISVTGDRESTPKDVCLAFSRIHYTKPLVDNSCLCGKLPERGYILEGDISEESIEDLLADL